jgi:hypothetical protein
MKLTLTFQYQIGIARAYNADETLNYNSPRNGNLSRAGGSSKSAVEKPGALDSETPEQLATLTPARAACEAERFERRPFMTRPWKQMGPCPALAG